MIPFTPCIAVNNTELGTIPITDGQLIVVIEEGALYFDYLNQRIALGKNTSNPIGDASDSRSDSDSSSSTSASGESSSSDSPPPEPDKLVPEAVTPVLAEPPAVFTIVNADVEVSASTPSGWGGQSSWGTDPETPVSVSGYAPSAVIPEFVTCPWSIVIVNADIRVSGSLKDGCGGTSGASGGNEPATTEFYATVAVTPVLAEQQSLVSLVNADVEVSASTPSGWGGQSGWGTDPETPVSVSGYAPSAVTPAWTAILPNYSIVHGNLS